MAKKKIKVGVKVPTLNELNKRYGNSVLMSADNIIDHGLWLPSTFFALNYQLGGGIPYGKILEIAGMESSGKSLAAFNFAYTCQQLNGHVIWVDAENAWTNDWALKNGLDLSKVTVINDTQVEVVSDALADLSIYWRSRLTNNEPILIVLDSIAALDTIDSINAKMIDGKAEMGGRAKAIYKMFRIRNEMFYKLGITQIYINQLRVSLSTGFGQDPNTTTGGKALGYYASIRLGFFGGKTLTVKRNSKERKIGRLVTVRVMKNKVAPPRTTISKAPMYFDAKAVEEIGFDRYYWLDDVLIELGVIEKSSGGVYKYKGETLCRGEEKFRELIKTDTKLRRRLLKAADINTIASTKRRATKLETNLFPLDGDVDYESQLEEDEEEEEQEE